MEEIVAYVAKLMENGMAYEVQGNVFFDVIKYNSRFAYSRLKQVNLAEQNDTEGETFFSGKQQQGLKRHTADFALWKHAKPGEPTWSSPWGLGRPGWHIECSAMTRFACDYYYCYYYSISNQSAGKLGATLGTRLFCILVSRIWSQKKAAQKLG